MMDKRKIYIAVIVVCLLGTAGILYWSGRDTSSHLPDTTPITNVDRTPDAGTQRTVSGEVPSPEGAIQFGTPSVFPSDTQLDLSVYESSKFQSLSDYSPLTVSPDQIGRENPYQSY